MRALVMLAVAVCLLAAAGAANHPGPLQSVDSLYAVMFTRGPAWDTLKSPGAQAGFQSHSANLGRLRREGRILMGGRFGDYGLVLVRARGADEARLLFAGDSAMAQGVFRTDFHVWRTFYDGTVPIR